MLRDFLSNDLERMVENYVDRTTLSSAKLDV